MKTDILIDAIGNIDENTISEAKDIKRNKAGSPFRKITALALAALLFAITAVPALAAADVEPMYQLLYAVAPSAAQSLKPVQKSCTDNGIKMEVVSAYIHDDSAEIYIAMRDLTENRIDGTVDLFDSYDIRNSLDCSGTCRLESFDEKTGIATFLVSIKQMNNRKFKGSKVTFSVSEFLSRKQHYEGVISELDLSSVSTSPQTQKDVYFRGGGDAQHSKMNFLLPCGTPLCVPTEGASVTAIGYINGKLHIQMYFTDIIKTDNHGWLWLQDSNGNLIDCQNSETFWDSEQSGSYQEYIFDVSYEEIANYKVYGEFETCNTLITGDWQVTFPMDTVN